MLAQNSLGRVAISVGALPAIRTVRYTLAEEGVIFRVAPESRLCQAVNNAVVALVPTTCDDSTGRGWSVVVQGRCNPVNDTERFSRLRSLPLMSRVDMPRRRRVHVHPALLR